MPRPYGRARTPVFSTGESSRRGEACLARLLFWYTVACSL